jgi:CubicO group peptidase (beta-lactamase class C family)
MMCALLQRRLATAGLLVVVVGGCAAPGSREGVIAESAGLMAPAPRFAPDGPDAEEYGASDGFPTGDRTTFFRIPFLVGSHSQLDQLFEGRLVRRADRPSRLGRAPSEPVLQYYYQGAAADLNRYLSRNPATGLLIARGETILVERYQYGRNDRHRFTSWSMAKTVTSMLVGIAIAEGRIRSVDDPASVYVPGLAGTEYGRTSLRHLLQMASGVRFTEVYSGRDDVARLARETFLQMGAGGVEAVTPFNERAVPAGTKFSYASVETQVLGLVLRSAVGRPVADYLAEKIWRPMGAEADATWLVDHAGQESTYCCINAVLRDYARLGLLLAHDGNWNGRRIIPAAWIHEATSVRPDQAHLKPGVATPFFGYGYQTWIFPGDRRMFALLGVRGQTIMVDPANRLVMVHTAVRKQPAGGGATEVGALWRAVVTTLAISSYRPPASSAPDVTRRSSGRTASPGRTGAAAGLPL